MVDLNKHLAVLQDKANKYDAMKARFGELVKVMEETHKKQAEAIRLFCPGVTLRAKRTNGKRKELVLQLTEKMLAGTEFTAQSAATMLGVEPPVARGCLRKVPKMQSRRGLSGIKTYYLLGV